MQEKHKAGRGVATLTAKIGTGHGKSGFFASSLNEGRRHASNHGVAL
jgi:hypothetical protein